MFSLVLLAGGKGTRMNQNIPKQFLLLAGKPIIMHTLEKIETIEEIKEVIIVINEDYVNQVKYYIKNYKLSKNYIFAKAGKTRQESVYNGLQKVNYENVIIHESARPFVKREEFINLINDESTCAIFGIDIPFTVLEAHENVERNLNRSSLVNVQLPQKYSTSILKSAHQKAHVDGKNFTEDASLVFEYESVCIKVIKGSEYNIKITTPIDLIIGELIYKEYIIGRD